MKCMRYYLVVSCFFISTSSYGMLLSCLRQTVNARTSSTHHVHVKREVHSQEFHQKSDRFTGTKKWVPSWTYWSYMRKHFNGMASSLKEMEKYYNTIQTIGDREPQAYELRQIKEMHGKTVEELMRQMNDFIAMSHKLDEHIANTYTHEKPNKELQKFAETLSFSVPQRK